MACFRLFSPFSSIQPNTSIYLIAGIADLIYLKKIKILGITLCMTLMFKTNKILYKRFLKIEQVLNFTESKVTYRTISGRQRLKKWSGGCKI